VAAQPIGKDDQEEREFRSDMAGKVKGHRMRFECEVEIQEMVDRAGGEEKLNSTQRALISGMRAELDRALKDNGYE
jgi:hypothetical protein